MILNLIVLGLGVKLIVGAVKYSRPYNPDGSNRNLTP
jgi:hypothetical protein